MVDTLANALKVSGTVLLSSANNKNYLPPFSRKVGLDCTDIDECVLGLNSCHEFANCINNPGSYRCSCDNGYEGDGHQCAFILQCDPTIGLI